MLLQKIAILVTILLTTSDLATRWKVGRYGQCSTSCGRGVQSRIVSCTQISRGNIVSDRICPPPKPASTRSCSTIACTPEWTAGTWSKCSKTCGRGTQHRQIYCSQLLSIGIIQSVPDDYCPRIRLQTRRKCAVIDCPPRYSLKRWGECTVSCGGGMQLREALCTRLKAETRSAEVIERGHCSHLLSPIVRRRCGLQKCPIPTLKRGSHYSRGSNAVMNFQRRRVVITEMPDLSQEQMQRLIRQPQYRSVKTENHQISDLKKVDSGRHSVHEYLCHYHNRSYQTVSKPAGRDTRLSQEELKLPCRVPQELVRKLKNRIPRNPGTLEMEAKRYTLPYIITQTDEAPSQVHSDIVTYVGSAITASDGHTVTLLCEASGSPPPVTEWLKDGSKILQDDRHIVLPDGSLRLINPIHSENGIYTCVASNIIGSYSASSYLNIATRPRILSTTQTSLDFQSRVVDAQIGSVIRASPGSTVRISCSAEGFPPPRIRWEKDVPGLGDNARILPDNRLEIEPASSVDQGLYNCEASNPIGTDYRTSALLLLETPHMKESFSPSGRPSGAEHGFPHVLMATEKNPVYKIRYGASAIFECPIMGTGKINWNFRNRPISNYSVHSGHHAFSDGKLLFLNTLGRDSEGTYSCSYANEDSNLTAALQVKLVEYFLAPGKTTECSHTCGGDGLRHVRLDCFDQSGEVTDDWYCDGISKPPVENIPCNRINCPPRFHIGTWGRCSKTCGRGEKSRKISCLILQWDNTLRSVGSSACARKFHTSVDMDEMIGNAKWRPASKESCILRACPTWRTGYWSQCGDKCYGLGMSIRVRRLYCLDFNSTAVSRLKCKQSERPKWRELCFTRKCEPVWVASSWSTCSRTCGNSGIQTRILSCVFRGDRRHRVGNLCDKSLRPSVSAPCGRIRCPP